MGINDQDWDRYQEWRSSWAGWDEIPDPPGDAQRGYNALHGEYGGGAPESLPMPESMTWGVPHRFWDDGDVGEAATRWGEDW